MRLSLFARSAVCDFSPGCGKTSYHHGESSQARPVAMEEDLKEEEEDPEEEDAEEDSDKDPEEFLNEDP